MTTSMCDHDAHTHALLNERSHLEVALYPECMITGICLSYTMAILVLSTFQSNEIVEHLVSFEEFIMMT